MMKSFRRALASTAAAFALSTAHALPVGLELALVIDVSGSISNAEYNLQRSGYVAAFNDPTIQANILSFAPSGGVAVAVFQFASSATTSINWVQIDSLADYTNFVTALGSMARSNAVGSGTDIPDGMALARTSMLANGFEGTRLVMDVSGDGTSNTTNTAAQRDLAAASLITVNGLPIGAASIQNFYNTNVRTANGFIEAAAGFDDFTAAVTRKIGRETDPDGNVPLPGIVLLMGLGLVALAQRKRSA
jgi:uncharacterized membrane protein YidH (DUF202 family)